MRDQRFGQLDSLRAFAVLAVVAHHTLDQKGQQWAEYGAYGVQLFFVISGFLITGILVDARQDAASAGQPMKGVFRSFYARRALRIFPVYYLTLAIGTAIGVQGIREAFGWNLLYLSNWRIALDGHWGAVTHVWSLAVEEQFYLIWPLVVLLTPRRLLPWAIGSMLAVAVVTHAVLLTSTNMWEDGVRIVTPAVLDSLGLGALLAVLWRGSSNVDRIVRWIGVLAVAVLAFDATVDRVAPSLSDIRAVTAIGWPLLFVWIIHHTARGVRGSAANVLTWRPLVYVGTVSYGIYLFHLFVIPVAEILGDKIGVNVPIPSRGPAQFVIVAAISIAVAALSWTLLERPINQQKYRFPYVRTDPAVGHLLPTSALPPNAAAALPDPVRR